MRYQLNPDAKHPEIRSIRSLLPYLWPKDAPTLRFRVVATFALLVVAKIISVLVPIFYKQAVDALSLEELSLITVPVLLLFAYGASRIFSQGFNELKEAAFAKVGQHAVRAAAFETFHHLHRLSLRFHLDRKTGGLSRAIERGVKAIEIVLRFSMFNIFPTFFEIVFVGLILLYLYEAKFALLTLLTLGLYIWYTIAITQWRTKFVRMMNKVDGEANTKAIDSLLNYETVKYFSNEIHEEYRFDKSLAEYEVVAVKNKVSLSVLNVGQGIIIAVGLTAIMLMAAYGVTDGSMTIGDFVLVNSYLIQLYLPLNILGFAYREIKLALVDMEHMFALLYVQPEIQDIPNAKALKVDKGVIVFDNVSFNYTPERKILHNVSFKVPAGKTVAIVGASGAGKSTISRLLFRFYDVTSGTIAIDGQDIHNVTQKSLRQSIGIVPQDTVLFNDSIYYNIAYGRTDASRQEIEAAAKLAEIHDFINILPDGYASIVGERGLKLSGGEKQRVAIARTILKHPNIFLFDEATSALDTHTEKAIQASLRKVSANRTTLVIAHRLSTIIDADQIIVLDKGQIVESGKHQQLLDKNGQYARMWKHQQEAKEKHD